jgi:hypothetical protein
VKIYGEKHNLKNSSWAYNQPNVKGGIDEKDLANFDRAEIKLIRRETLKEEYQCAHIGKTGTCGSGWCYIGQSKNRQTSDIYAERDSTGKERYYVEVWKPLGEGLEGSCFKFWRTRVMYKIEGRY